MPPLCCIILGCLSSVFDWVFCSTFIVDVTFSFRGFSYSTSCFSVHKFVFCGQSLAKWPIFLHLRHLFSFISCFFLFLSHRFLFVGLCIASPSWLRLFCLCDSSSRGFVHGDHYFPFISCSEFF